MTDIQQIKTLLSLCSPAQRQEVFRSLRKEFPIHPLEVDLNTDAEIILEAIHRSGGLTLRMMRGVIAEAAFEINVVESLKGWSNITPRGDFPYDFLLDDGKGAMRVQVKLQRSVEHRPMMTNESYQHPTGVVGFRNWTYQAQSPAALGSPTAPPLASGTPPAPEL